MLFTGTMVRGQTPATLTDLGGSAPTPGPDDISQLSTVGQANKPDALNYYTDNQSNHSSGEPGQTFTTGGAPGGYLLTSLTVKPDIREGFLYLPSGPGWGTEVNEEAVRAHPAKR